mmetsp:Transcript_24733/g.55706  ORF Transcript_24733/g.55706 Transcript_24733/m.55706 type:complete len:204 (-) Transcript_24733:39-650(-)
MAHKYLNKVRAKERHRAGDEVGGEVRGEGNHGEAAVFELLLHHHLLACLVLGHQLKRVPEGLAGGPVVLGVEGLEHAHGGEDLHPSLRRHLRDGLDGVHRGHVVRGKFAEDLRGQPAGLRKHGDAAVAELGRPHLVEVAEHGEAERVEGLAADLEGRAECAVRDALRHGHHRRLARDGGRGEGGSSAERESEDKGLEGHGRKK